MQCERNRAEWQEGDGTPSAITQSFRAPVLFRLARLKLLHVFAADTMRSVRRVGIVIQRQYMLVP